MKNNYFIPGLSDSVKNYRFLKNIKVLKINWNDIKVREEIIKPNILIGFSLGAIVASMISEKKKNKVLILCSPTPDENWSKIKTDKLIVIVGEKEKFCIKYAKEAYKTFKGEKKFIIIPKADHKITGNYRKKLLEIIKRL